MVVNKLIYREEHKDKYKCDTWVELIGEGHYAITQTKFNKGMTSTIFLTRSQIEEILKEQEVK